MSQDDATTPLVRSTRTRSSSSSLGEKPLFTYRVLTITTLVLLVCVSLYGQWEVHQLSVKASQDESQIHSLQDTLHNQAKVIERFNNSVTNSDVIARLDTLESTLTNTEKALKKDLRDTQSEIDDRLNETLAKLGKTVQKAEDDIHNQVELVKADVEEYVRTTQDQFSMENSFMVYQLAGTFTLLSCLISMWHMTAHLRRFNQPVVQRKILAILWMSPIYAITSWFSLVFPAAEGYLAIIKDFYEAYVIYQFLSFCIAVLGRGDREAVVDLLARHADHLTPPFRPCGCFCPDPYDSDRELADAVLMQCQRWAMQFVFLRPLTSVALVVLQKMNYYGAGTSATDWRSPQFYIIGIQNLSVFVAFAGLLKFYHAVDQDLAWCRPFAKFLCIKGVVFMTFWQGLCIAVLATTTNVAGDDAEQWAMSAQNFLICLEMLLFSIAHFYCFPTDEWEEGYQAAHSEGQFGDSIALGDFMQDLKLVLRTAQKKKKRRKSKKVPSEPTVPEEGESDDDEPSEEGVEVDISEQGTSVASGYTESSNAEEEAIIEDLLERGSDVDDDEIEEATKRLLAHTLLQGEVDAIWDDEEEVEAGMEQALSGETEESEHDDTQNGEKGETCGDDGSDVHPVGYGTSDQPRSGGQASSDEPPTERSSLLAGNASSSDSLRTPNDEILQPSIFTTLTDIDTSTRMSFN